MDNQEGEAWDEFDSGYVEGWESGWVTARIDRVAAAAVEASA